MAFVISGGERTTGSMIVPDPGVPLTSIATHTYGNDVWRTQPNVRTVVDFIARNVAQIPLRAYQRVDSTDRRRLHDHPLARTLERPMSYVPPYRFWHGLMVDWLIHDRWCAVKMPDENGHVRLQRLPADRYELHGDILDNVTAITVRNARGEKTELEPPQCVFDHGYAPSGVNGTSPIETLKDILAESREAVEYRRQVWNNGARIPAVIERPSDAPEWSPNARSRFREDMRGYLSDGAKAGGVPILEDGMTLSKVDAFTPQDTQDIEGRQLSAVEVAAAYHVPPELVGFRQGNYSNVREYRQQLYRDVLGPLIAAVEQVINVMLVPDFDGSNEIYAEFNVDAKLRASFEEQAAVLQTAVGAPYLTRNEARSMQNRPAMDGADELVTPLNVTTGGLASPRDTAPKQAGTKTADKQERPDADAETTALGDELAAFYERQSRSVLSKLGAKSKDAAPPLADAWDEDRWHEELSTLLVGRLQRMAAVGALGVLDRFNPDSEGFALSKMDNYLHAAANNHADEINLTTYRLLAEAILGDDWKSAVREAFGTQIDDAANRAGSLATEAVNFGSHDAARSSGLTRKRWRTTSSEPRPSHAAVNGETVPIEGMFSVGGRWPGDTRLPPWERVNCRCRLEYVTEE